MILRKPYAFLIKHFKLIHLILTVLMFLFFQRIREVVEYFNYYIDLNTFENITGLVREQYDIWYILLPLIIIAVIVLIMWLLITKEKPVKYYIISIISYVIELIMMIITYVLFTIIQQGEPDSNLITIFRDLIDLLSYLPIPLLIVSLARGVGFNVKQFNFKKDMSELNISDEDNEEFEVEVNVDTEDIRAKINRKKRFIQYVYLENKAVFWIVGTISVVVISLVGYFLVTGGEKIYKEGEMFKAYNVEVTVDKSYKTEYTATDKLIKDNKFYIIVSLNINNILNEENNLPYNRIYLKLPDDNKYSPINNLTEYFNEFGFRYTSISKLNAQENKKVILVYELDKKYINSTYRLEYLIKEEERNGQIEFEYAKVDLSPQEYNSRKLVTEKKLGETLTFDGSLLEGTEITISEIDFNEKYSYIQKQIIGGKEYEFTKTIKFEDESKYKKTIMRLKVDLKKNSKLNQKIYSSIFEKYANIEYEENGKTTMQNINIIDITPSNSEYIYLEVKYAIKESTKTSLVFMVRDKEYKYELVNKEEK